MTCPSKRPAEYQNLPDSLLGYAFSFLDRKEQAIKATCRAWRCAANGLHLGDFLTCGRRDGVRCLSTKAPTVSTFHFTPSQLIDTRDNLALLLYVDGSIPFAKVLNLQSGHSKITDLSESLSDLRNIRAARILSPSKFLTIERESIKIWHLETDKSGRAELITDNLEGSRVILGEKRVCIENNNNGTCTIFDFQKEDLRILPWNPRQHIALMLHGARIIAISENAMFIESHYHEDRGDDDYYPTQRRLLLSLNLEDSSLAPFWKFPNPIQYIPYMDRRWIASSCEGGVIGANDQFVVRATVFSGQLWKWPICRHSCPLKVSFDIIDAKSGNICASIEEDYTHLSNKFNTPDVFPNICWLCNEFVVVWRGEELDIWYIPSVERVATLNMKDFCQPDERANLDPLFSPVTCVEIKNGKIRLMLQNYAGTKLQVIEYTMNSHQDKGATERARDPQPRRMTNRPWRKLSCSSRIYRIISYILPIPEN